MCSFTALPLEVQLRVLAHMDPWTRYNATLTCRLFRRHLDDGVALYRRLHQLMADKVVQRNRAIMLEITAETRAHQFEHERGQRICVRGVRGAWVISSVIGQRVTRLRTPSAREAVADVARLLPDLRAVSVRPLNIVRVAPHAYPSHLLRGPAMALEGQPWTADLPAHCAGSAGEERLRVLVEHLAVFDTLHVRYEERPGRTTIERPDDFDFEVLGEWPRRAFLASHTRFPYDTEGVYSFCAAVEEVVDLVRPHRVASIELERNFGSDRQHFRAPDFAFEAPAYARPLAPAEPRPGDLLCA